MTFSTTYLVPPAVVTTWVISDYIPDAGALPSWIAIVVTCLIWWDARQAKKNSAKAETTAAESVKVAAEGVAKIESVSKQIDGLLTARDKAKVAEGELIGEQVGAKVAAAAAEGQRVGIEIGRDLGPVSVPDTDKSDKPLPVADDRSGDASERVAKATERLASAIEDKEKQTK